MVDFKPQLFKLKFFLHLFYLRRAHNRCGRYPRELFRNVHVEVTT